MITDRLLNYLRQHHEGTYLHSLNVGRLCGWFAKRLYSTEYEQKLLHQAGLLHDIGKLEISRDLLTLKRKLTQSEYELIKTHVDHGVNILNSYQLHPMVIEGVAGHHERLDGSGYPLGAIEISTFSQIISVSDVYSAMTEKREYRDAIDRFEVIKKMKSEIQGLNQEYVNMLREFASQKHYEIITI